MQLIPTIRIKPYQLLKQVTQLFAYAYSAFISCYFILRLIFWDRLWLVAFVSTFIPFIFLPLLLLPFAAFFIIKKRWFSIISSIGCILLLSWLHMKYWSFQPIPINASQPSIKILSLNTSWYKTNSETLVNLIQQQQPDIVCLQEIVPKHTRTAFVWLKTSYPYQVNVPKAGILSKYPIRFAERLNLAGKGEFQQRVIVQINQQDVVLYNIQVTPPWIRPQKILPYVNIPAYQYADRSIEIQDLVQKIQKETVPFIVAGDFNMTDQSQDYNYLKAVMQDSFEESGRGFGFTWPHGWPINFIIKKLNWRLNYPLVRIDYIWYSKHWSSEYSKVLPATGSDHLPIAAELTMLSK